MRNRLRSYGRFFAGLRPFLDAPISEQFARERLKHRFEAQQGAFLALMRRAVFDRPRSPYGPLLRAAGCDYADLESELRQRELPQVLQRLAAAGVRISLDELKGRSPIERPGVALRTKASDFDNPLVDAGIETSTGGSTGSATRMSLDLDFMTERACYDHLIFRMLGASSAPLALWLPELPASSGIGSSLRYAKIGHPAERWFSLRLGRDTQSLAAAAVTRLVVARSRGCAAPLAWPHPLGHEQAHVVVDWIQAALARHGRCVLHAYVSTALRVAHAARERGCDLSNTQLMLGSERVTPTKRREIEASGAEIYPRYFATEAGSIGFGCGDRGATDDYHVAEDTLALIHPPEAAGDSPQPLLVTSLLASGPKVLLNVDLGDVGRLSRRRCGCLFGEVGFDRHVTDVGSVQRATGEGVALPYADLERIVEEFMPQRCGGNALDYQWVESEDERGFTRLGLRASPRLGAIDPAGLADFVFAKLVELDARSAFHVEVWRKAGTFRLLREAPTASALGKLHPLTRSGTNDQPSGSPHSRSASSNVG